MDVISTKDTGQNLDKWLKAISDAQDAENNGMILYIHNGVIDFDTEEHLFTLAKWE